MRKWFCITLFIMLVLVSFAEQRKDKLSEINKQIEQQKEKINQIKFEQKKAKNKKTNYSNKLDWSEKQLEKIQKQKKEYLSKLNDNMKDISKTGSELSFYEKKCLQNIEYAIKLETYKKVYKKDNPDKRYILELINITNSEIENLSNKKENLLNKKNKFSSKLKNINNISKREEENANWAKNRINYYAKKIYKNEKEKRSFSKTLSKLELKAKAMIELIQKLDIIEKSHDYSYKFDSDKIIWPVEGTVIRNYGLQKFANKTSINNNGIDIETKTHDKIVAIYGGVVAFAKWEEGIGKIIIIDHQNGFLSSYCYPEKLLVLKGDRVKTNQTIAISGNKDQGKSVIHFELRKDGHPVNPIDYLE